MEAQKVEKLVFIGDLEPYEQEKEGTRKRQYRRLLEQADRYRSLELPREHPKESTTYMGIAILNLALAYRLSRKEEYLEDAKRFMETVLSYEKWGNAHLVNVDLSASWILFGLSLGYDWLKPWLTEEEKERIAQKIFHHGEIMLRYRRDTYGKGWSTNFWQNHNWINMTGLAAAGYVLSKEPEGSKARRAAPEYVKEARDDFERVFSYMAEDGSNYEGVTYWRYGGMWLFVYAHLLKVQEGRDYFKESSYLRNTFYYRLYQSCGDLKQQMNYGDCHDRHSGHTACVYYKTAAEYKDGFAQRLGNLVTDRFLMEEAAQSKVKPGILPEAVFEYLWYDPNVEEKDLSELPKVHYFEDLGLLGMRDGWTPDSKVFTIKCGYPGGRKQWEIGWKLYEEENIKCLSLSHHHPDNLSYLFAKGGEYLTCEDGYNRNIMPDNHNVILADGMYTDAVDVSDVYMSSARMRMKGEEAGWQKDYGGRVTLMKEDGPVVIYRGETSGVYPRNLEMEEVSRLFFTYGLEFWVFVDVVRSRKEHVYEILSNTDPKAQNAEGGFVYHTAFGPVFYSVFSDKETEYRTYTQDIESIMTTQEPDKVCRTSINTLSTRSKNPQKQQVFFECFAFSKEDTKAELKGGILKVDHKGRSFEFQVIPQESPGSAAAIRIQVTDEEGAKTCYNA
jgi:hypothetical protein